MRRTAVLLAALGYGLSFLAVCLGACMGAAPATDHGCCTSDEEAFRAAGRDCCAVMPGLGEHSTVPAHHGAPPAAATTQPAPGGHTAALHFIASTVPAPSPPLILRI
jgi:hypothetical protein